MRSHFKRHVSFYCSCDVIINVFEDATRVTVCDTACSACGAQQVTVEYRAERTRLPAAITEMTACLYCEPTFSALVSIVVVSRWSTAPRACACPSPSPR